MSDKAAQALAAEFAPELLDEQPKAGDREILFDEDLVYLRPGITLNNDTVYITVPAVIKDTKQVGTGKNATTKEIKKVDWIVATSDRRYFTYDEPRVSAEGMVYPETGVPPMGNGHYWDTKDLRQYLNGADHPADPLDTYTEVRKVYEKYVEFPDDRYYDLVALYVMASYVYSVFPSTGYIHFNGTFQSGKSQNLNVLSALGFNTVHTSNISAAALYRMIEGSPGIVCIDEAESFEGEKGEAIRQLLNDGYNTSGRAHRMGSDASERMVLQQFQTYCPKVIASIAPLDNVLGSRTLVVPMRPAIRRIPEFNVDKEEWTIIRNQLYLWAMYHMPQINELAKKWNDERGELRTKRAPRLVGRSWQVSQQIVIVADYIGGEAFAAEIIDWLNEYFREQQAQLDATDRVRLTLRSLPRVLNKFTQEGDGYYKLQDIFDTMVSYLDTDAADHTRTGTINKYLGVLGFRTKKAAKGGSHIQVKEDQVREAFKQRRVEPFEEDIEWLRGDVDYQTSNPMQQVLAAKDDLWTSYAEDADVEPEEPTEA